jgi:hypothetical protein
MHVELAAGETISAARDPIWYSEALIARPIDGGTRWDAPDGGVLRFSPGPCANVTELQADGSGLVIAASLVLLWVGQLHLDPLEAFPGLALASGEARFWLSYPGYPEGWPYRNSRKSCPSVVVDPALVVWVKPGGMLPQPVPGPAGRDWLRLTAADEAQLHTWSDSGRQTGTMR